MLHTGLRQILYEERLKIQDLCSLDRHRVRDDLFLIFKMPSGLTNMHTDQFFDPRPPRNRRGHPRMLSSHTLRHHFMRRPLRSLRTLFEMHSRWK